MFETIVKLWRDWRQEREFERELRREERRRRGAAHSSDDGGAGCGASSTGSWVGATTCQDGTASSGGACDGGDD